MDVQVTPPNGRIEVITGCMFSSKTEELIHRAQRAEIAGQNILAFKPKIDDRYEKNHICSHNGVTVDAIPIENDEEGARTVVDIVLNKNYNYIDDIDLEFKQEIISKLESGIDVIVFDEINFFSDDIVEVIEKLAEEQYRIIMSGLDQTFRGEPFYPVPQLLSIADHVEKRQAVCESCGIPATRTQRLIDGEPAYYNSPTIDVGSNEKYEPRCRECHKVPRKND